MANTMRMSSFMLKCSMCAEEIEISMMGDHVCKPASKPIASLVTESSNTQNKAGRFPPARIDTRAANRPFTQQDQLAPVSESSDSRSASPRTPPYHNNHNNNHNRVLDGENESVVEVQSNGHVPFVGANDAFSKSRTLPAPQHFAPADPRYAPVSSRSVAGSGLLDKMNTIAPGPFDARQQAPSNLAEKASNEDVLAALPATSTIKGHHSRSSTASSLRSHSSKASTSSSNYTVAAFPAKPVVNSGGYTAFSPGLSSKFQNDGPRALLGAGSRSNTFPELPTQQSFGLPRRPSESTGLRRPSNVKSDNNEELDGNTFVRTSPPRETARRNLSISNGKPPPPRGMSFSAGRDISAINLAAEFGTSNPYHTSTTSQSSNGSAESRSSKMSSRSSPPSSIEPQARRKPSVTAGLDIVTDGLQQAIKQEALPLSPPQAAAESSRTVAMPPPILDPSLIAPESPMDPAIHAGRLSPMPQQAFPPGTRAPTGPLPRQPLNHGRTASATPQGSQQRGPSPQQRPPPGRAPPPPSGPVYGLPSRPNAPLLAQKGIAQGRRPSQHNNTRPQPPQNYNPNRSPTTSMFPPDQQNPHPQGQQGRHPSHANFPSPNNEFPQGRRPSHTNVPAPQVPSSAHQGPNQARLKTPTNRPPPQDGYFPQGHRPSPSQIRPLQPPPIPADTTELRPNTSSGRPTTAKGDCKGCGKPITGKSVSSADGRLTGRYHKECFVCKTCRSPFPSAEFYVIRDSPYCEEHYHRLNNSVCAARECGRGIEGQFLETERRAKYHPECLRCMAPECREVLRGDYYEVRGGVFCERDALRQQQQMMHSGRGGGRLGPGRGGPMGMMSRMEKRTTRLMMM